MKFFKFGIQNKKSLTKFETKSFLKLSKSNLNTKDDFEKISLENKYNPEIVDKQKQNFTLIGRLPEKIQLYLQLGRYDRPVGYMLLFWPCTWGLTLGSPGLSVLYFKCLALYFSGSVLMRSSGCIINDMWDKNIDSKVIRSANRPLANNKLTYKQASIFLSAHLAVSLWILLQLPLNSIYAGLGIMPIVCIYPYMKRVTHFPQFFLGLAFNSGIIVGLASITGVIPFEIAVPLYSAGILWTLIYDTIYAHMDKSDDIKISVKSTAIFFGDNSKIYFGLFTILMMYLFYLAIYYSKKKSNNKNKNVTNVTYGLLGLGTLFQFYSIYQVDLNSPLSCLKHFKANSWFGMIIFMACLCSLLDK